MPVAWTSSTAASVAMLRAFATAKNDSNESSEKTAISARRISPIWVLDPAPHWERIPVGFTEMNPGRSSLSDPRP